MNRQVHAIFIFIGVVVLSAAFFHGVGTSENPQTITRLEVPAQNAGVATALLAVSDRPSPDPFGLNVGGLTDSEMKRFEFLSGIDPKKLTEKESQELKGLEKEVAIYQKELDQKKKEQKEKEDRDNGDGSSGEDGSGGGGGNESGGTGINFTNSGPLSGNQGGQPGGGGDIETPSNEQPIPTICNVFINQPELGGLVGNTITVAGFVDSVEESDCLWTIFEANAGYVEVFDDNNNLISQPAILSSLGNWMEFPSYFQTLVALTQTPETSTGYIRFHENVVVDGVVPDVFDYPVSFQYWDGGQNVDGGLIDSIANFFRNRNQGIRSGVSAPRETTDIFGGGSSRVNNNSQIPVISNSDRVGVSESSDDYCEVRNGSRLVCYGQFVDEDTCGCSVFPGLETLRDSSLQESYTPETSRAPLEKNLYIGDRGPDVESLQSKLYSLGYYEGIPSGVYEGSTARSLREYQRDNGIAGFGFILGKKARAALNEEFSN
jgi:hypothetical protein